MLYFQLTNQQDRWQHDDRGYRDFRRSKLSIDLSECDLKGIELTQASLGGANLTEAILVKAMLWRVDLRQGRLTSLAQQVHAE